MELENLTVKQLRAKAKDAKISPLPTRKKDLIGALRTVERDRYTLNDLKSICVAHKEQLSFKCNEKGLTRDILLERLSDAGVLELVGKNTFFTELKTRSPDLVTVVQDITKYYDLLKPFFSTFSQAKTAEKDIWGILLTEYDELLSEGYENLVKALNTERTLADFSDNELQNFVEIAPLIAYSYARTHKSLYRRLERNPSAKLAQLSSLLRETDVALSFRAPERSGYLEDSYIGELPQELQYEIFRKADLDAKRTLLQTTNAIREAEARYRSVHARYGEYTLSVAQNVALEWLYDVMPQYAIAIVKAPPSWGKTALAVAAAIEAVREGRTVAIHTTPAMVPFFLETLEKMLGRQFPDMEKPVGQDGRVAILAPSFNSMHRDAYKQGVYADILVLGGPQNASGRYYHASGPQNRGRVPHPLEQYHIALVIVDEAHKGNVSILVNDYLRRSAKTKFLLVSANVVKLISGYLHTGVPDANYIEEIRLVFSSANIVDEVPGLEVEIRDTPNNLWLEEAEQFSRKTQDWIHWHAERSFARLTEELELLEELHAELSGNIVAFTPWSYRSSYKSHKNSLESIILKRKSLWTRYAELVSNESLIIHNKSSDLKKFTERSTTKPSIFYTTYNKSAEGLNLNTVDNVVLFGASEAGRKKLYQAMARAQRINNPRHKVRVILFSAPTLHGYLSSALKMVREDFLEDLERLYRGKVQLYCPSRSTIEHYVSLSLGNKPLPKNSAALLFYYLVHTKRPSVAEVYFLFARRKVNISKDEINKLFDARGMFTTMDRDVIINMTRGEYPKLRFSPKELSESLNKAKLSKILV